MSKQIKVTLVRSGLGRQPQQRRTLVALGLKRPGSVRVLPDNPAIRGMIFQVKHLIHVEAA